MVDDGHFDKGVPLFRCMKRFICQFGIPAEKRQWYPAIKDDPNWLPEGPTGRVRNGRKRFPKGYLAYAGGGIHSRGTQLIVALADNDRLAGGSPWEVPWGQVALSSFDVLDAFFTGYGDKGPSQGDLSRRGFDPRLRAAFPDLDSILSCFRLGTL